MRKLRDLYYELLEYPPYSPDLGSSDLHPFPTLKLFLAGQRFPSDQEVTSAVEGYLVDLTENHFRDRTVALECCWNGCVTLKDYVDKNLLKL